MRKKEQGGKLSAIFFLNETSLKNSSNCLLDFAPVMIRDLARVAIVTTRGLARVALVMTLGIVRVAVVTTLGIVRVVRVKTHVGTADVMTVVLAKIIE